MSDNRPSLADLLGVTRSQPLANLFNAQSPRARWSARFETWAKPLSPTEKQKCENAESVVRSAIDHEALSKLNLSVSAQGSYKANTNVRADSDVDIRVQCSSVFFYELSDGITREEANLNSPATLTYPIYRGKIEAALRCRFNDDLVDGDKAFNIKENTYRITVDVVPTFDYRFYYRLGNAIYYRKGACFFSKSGDFIINWPDETLANGKKKNTDTSMRYKKVVRVLKGIRNEMEENGYESAKKISSHQIACLAYNVSNGFYGNDDLYDDVKSVVGQIWYHAYDPSRGISWTEIDGIKPLFPDNQPSKFKDVAEFMWHLQEYTNLKD